MTKKDRAYAILKEIIEKNFVITFDERVPEQERRTKTKKMEIALEESRAFDLEDEITRIHDRIFSDRMNEYIYYTTLVV